MSSQTQASGSVGGFEVAFCRKEGLRSLPHSQAGGLGAEPSPVLTGFEKSPVPLALPPLFPSPN